jgi:hypothetical protein
MFETSSLLLCNKSVCTGQYMIMIIITIATVTIGVEQIERSCGGRGSHNLRFPFLSHPERSVFSDLQSLILNCVTAIASRFPQAPVYRHLLTFAYIPIMKKALDCSLCHHNSSLFEKAALQ